MSSITCVVIIVVFIYIFLYFIWVVRHAIFYVSVEPNTFLVFFVLVHHHHHGRRRRRRPRRNDNDDSVCTFSHFFIAGVALLLHLCYFLIFYAYCSVFYCLSSFSLPCSRCCCCRCSTIWRSVGLSDSFVYKSVYPPLLWLLLSLVSVSPSRLVRSSIQPNVRLVALELYI